MAARAYLLFELAGLACALACEHVREILPLPALGQPPARPPVIEGVIALGGQAIPLLRLDRLLGLPQSAFSAYQHVLLMRGREPPFALLVDRVTEIARIAETRVLRLDEEDSYNGCVTAEIRIDGQPIHGLCLERLLTAEERNRLAAFQAQEEERLREFASPA